MTVGKLKVDRVRRIVVGVGEEPTDRGIASEVVPEGLEGGELVMGNFDLVAVLQLDEPVSRHVAQVEYGMNARHISLSPPNPSVAPAGFTVIGPAWAGSTSVLRQRTE